MGHRPKLPLQVAPVSTALPTSVPKSSFSVQPPSPTPSLLTSQKGAGVFSLETGREEERLLNVISHLKLVILDLVRKSPGWVPEPTPNTTMPHMAEGSLRNALLSYPTIRDNLQQFLSGRSL